jgi:hypothetical protein
MSLVPDGPRLYNIAFPGGYWCLSAATLALMVVH